MNQPSEREQVENILTTLHGTMYVASQGDRRGGEANPLNPFFAIGYLRAINDVADLLGIKLAVRNAKNPGGKETT